MKTKTIRRKKNSSLSPSPLKELPLSPLSIRKPKKKHTIYTFRIKGKDHAKRLQLYKENGEIPLVFFKYVCKNSGECIGFGNESNTILQYFDHFSHFDYLQKLEKFPIDSVNGFIYELKYEKEGYNAYSILKSNQQEDTDSLYIEYMNGKYINEHFVPYFPCFLYTYQLLKYKSDEAYRYMRDNNVQMEHMNLLLDVNNNMDLLEACDNPIHIAILLQHVHTKISLHSFLENEEPDIISRELLPILLQIYIVLRELKEIFTHYDLHLANVLLYKPFENRCILYKYKVDNTEIVFYSSYIVKLIDYGRAYTKNSEDINLSMMLYNDRCHRILEKNERMCDRFQICSKKNESYDIQLLIWLKEYRKVENKIKELSNRVEYRGVENGGYIYNRIQNVEDAYYELSGLHEKRKEKNREEFKRIKVEGECRIEKGVPMNFFKLR
jgi:hypothetical protein